MLNFARKWKQGRQLKEFRQLTLLISGTPIAVKYFEVKISSVLRSKTHAN